MCVLPTLAPLPARLSLDDLHLLSQCAGPALTQVTQLTLELHGRWRPILEVHTTRRPGPGTATADLAQAITGHCGPLTHFTVSGKAFEGASNFMCTAAFLRLLQAIKTSCTPSALDSTSAAADPAASACAILTNAAATAAKAAGIAAADAATATSSGATSCFAARPAAAVPATLHSLTHLLISTDEGDFLEGDDCLIQYPCANQVLMKRASDELQAFTALTHVALPARGTYALWESLPHTLQELSLHNVVSGPYLGLSLPSLHTLTLRACSCRELALLLAACPLLTHLRLEWLGLWGGVNAVADLHAISAHAVLRLDCVDRHGRGAAPMLAIGVKGQQRDQLLPAQLLRQLPVMPAILRCSINFRLAPLVDLRDLQAFRASPGGFPTSTEPCMQHISRTLPSLQHLVLKHVRLEGLDLSHLQDCSALQQLELVSCSGFSAGELQLLAKRKPQLDAVGSERLAEGHHNKDRALEVVVQSD